MENTGFFEECLNLSVGEVLKKGSLTFEELFSLKYPPNYRKKMELMFFWDKVLIHAVTKEDMEMRVWNQIHPVDKNTTKHICKKGTRVLVWMVSRMGDVGVTDNLKNPKGYDIRIDIEKLENFEILKERT